MPARSGTLGLAGLLLVLACQSKVSFAQQSEAEQLPYTNAAQIRKLSAAQAARSFSAHLQGVVITEAGPRDHAGVIWDGTAGIYLLSASNHFSIRKEFPDAKIIVLTTFDTDEDIYRAIQSGASSYLLKDTPDDELSATIRAVYAGEHPLPAKVAERLALRQKRSDLSHREMEVLQLLTKGRSNKEIGSSLFISEDTVKAHLKSLFTKLQVQDRTEAAITAIRQGIVHLE